MKQGILVAIILSFTIEAFSAALSSRRSLSCRNPVTDEECMTCNCFNEAGDQPFMGQVAVGAVVMSRIYVNQQDRQAQNRGSGRPPRYASTVCGVIKQHRQFSWLNRRSTRQRVPAGHACFRAAALSLQFEGFYADHYHANYVRPRWARRMQRVGTDRVGRDSSYHIFYA